MILKAIQRSSGRPYPIMGPEFKGQVDNGFRGGTSAGPKRVLPRTTTSKDPVPALGVWLLGGPVKCVPWWLHLQGVQAATLAVKAQH